jgi:hypothetical protein
VRIGHLQPTRPEWYDRNPSAILRGYQGVAVNGTPGGSTPWQYTVPTGKKCYIDSLQTVISVSALRTAAGNHGAIISLSQFAGSIDLLRAELYENVYGAGVSERLAAVGAIGAGDYIFGAHWGASTGTYNVYISAKMTEYDA